MDEPAHYAYIQNIVEKGKLPLYGESYLSKEIDDTIQKIPINQHLYLPFGGNSYQSFWDSNQTSHNTDFNSIINLPHSLRTDDSDITNWETQQPPLSYLVFSIFYKIFQNNNIFTIVYLLRYVSIAISAISILIIFKISSMLFKNQFMKFGIVIFIIFNPMFVMNFSRISNEPLTFLLFSIFLFFTIRFLKEDYKWTYPVYLGITLGLGIISKQSFLSPLVLVPIIIILKTHQNKIDLKTRLYFFIKNNFLVFIPAISLGSWWYIRNLILTGNLSGVSGLRGVSPYDFISFSYLHGLVFMRELFLNFWGLFGWSYIRLMDSFYDLSLIITLISITGLLLFIFEKRKNFTEIARMWKYQILIIFCLSILVLIVGMLYVDYGYYLQSGRTIILSFAGSWYSFADAISISTIFIGGLKIWLEKIKANSKISLLIMTIIMICFNTYVLFYITSYYYQT